MGDSKIIQFPTGRRLQAAARSRAEAGGQASTQAATAEQSQAASAAPFAFLSVEIRRLPRADSRIDGDVAGRVLNRCVLTSLEVLAKEKIPVDLAGTVLRPIVEGTFHGPDGVVRAARAASALRESIRRVQREVELEFHPFGAITLGATSAMDSGVKVTSGSPEQVAARLREHAAPGQILLSEAAWRTCEKQVAVSEPAIEVTVPGSDPVATYPLVSV
jgi:class 3 adenylate cyclase